MRMPKKTSVATIEKIQEDGRSHMPVPAIATENSVSEGTVLKYLALAEIKPTYGAAAQEAKQTIPREAGSSEAEEPTPTIYPPVGVVPPRRRGEVRTDFSQPADELTDIARSLQARQTIEQLANPRESALDVALKLDDLSKRQREPLEAELEQRDTRITELERMVSELKRRDERGEMLLSIERLRGEQEIGRTQLQLSIEELRHSNQIELKKMEIGSDAVQQGRFWMKEVLPDLPTIVEKSVTGLFKGLSRSGLKPGQLLQNSRNVIKQVAPDGAGIEVGGLVMETPVKLSDVRKVIRVRGPTGERVEPTDAEWSEELEALELLGAEDLRNERRQHRGLRDHPREEVLATQLAEARRELAELRSRAPAQPSPPSERRVLTASKPAEASP